LVGWAGPAGVAVTVDAGHLRATSLANPAGDLDAAFRSPDMLSVAAADDLGGVPLGRYHNVLDSLRGERLHLDEIDIRPGTAATIDAWADGDDVAEILPKAR
jgi:hypothetical protein